MLCSTSAIWGKALCADPVAAENRTQRARQTLLSGGWSGLEALVQEDAEQRTRQAQAAVEGLLDDLTPHQDHLHYAQRLASGQSSGSSQIEGAGKNLIGRRLKANAARWRVR